MAFHVKDGWQFERLDDGSVQISKQAPVPGGDADLILHRIMLDATTWAAVVAAMSPLAEFVARDVGTTPIGED